MHSKAQVKGKSSKSANISKPFLTGRVISTLIVRRGLRIFSYVLLSTVFYFFLGQLFVIDTLWLRVLANLAVLLAFGALFFRRGGRDGEGDVAFAEISLGQQQAGKTISQGDLARSYHPLKGFATVIVGLLPLICVCLVYAFLARKQNYTLGALPSWLNAYDNRADLNIALAYYNDRAGIGFLDILRLVVRLLVFPFVNIAGSNNPAAVLLVERLSPLLVTLAPLGYGLGYLRGEEYRARVHQGIASNAKRAARKQKKKAQPRRQEPRQLV